MGLDMYLNKKYYVQNWSHMKPEELHHITILKGDKASKIPTEKITEIVTQEMYWRKANAIHQWFVRNVQNGEDDCREYYVDRDQLKELYDACVLVLESSELVKGKISNGYTIENGVEKENLIDGEYINNPAIAKRLLPTTSGFFFGSTDYNQYYLDDIKYTAEELKRLLAEHDGGSFYYSSSW
jgi:hypothetical protein